MPSDLLSTIRAEIVARLDELRPLILEYEQLLSASEALGRQGWATPGSGAFARSGLAPAASSGASARAGAAASTRGGPSAPGATRSSGRRRRAGETPSGGTDRARVGSATEVSSRSASGARRRTSRPRRNEASAAILAALEHGSHTAAELTVVTGLSAASIRRDLRALLREGAISRTTRAGKTAYVLLA